MKKLITLYLALSLTLLAGSALADQSYSCTHGKQERSISIVYQDQVKKVPCEVQYTKDGVTQTLWSAKGQVGYCEEKALAFVEKQRGWGWACEEVKAAQ